MSQGKESTASLLNSMCQRKSTKSGRELIPNPRYITGDSGSGGGGRGGGGPPPHSRGARGRGGGRPRGEGGRGRGGGRALPEGSDIPSASGDVASESRELESRDEETQSRDEGTVSGAEGAVTGGEGSSKKPRIRGESRVPPESKMPKTEEEKVLIVPNDVE